MIFGHDGAGIVREVGPGVTPLQPGDRLIAHGLPLEQINDAFDLMHEGTVIES